MTRSQVRVFINSGINALDPSIGFNSGRVTEFNSQRSNEYPFIWLESLSRERTITGTGAPQDNWNVVLHIAKKDSAGSTPEQYERIVDQCDEIARALSNQYDHALTDSVNVTRDSESVNPFIHKHADDTTGVIMSFVLTTYDNSSFCE